MVSWLVGWLAGGLVGWWVDWFGACSVGRDLDFILFLIFVLIFAFAIVVVVVVAIVVVVFLLFCFVSASRRINLRIDEDFLVYFVINFISFNYTFQLIIFYHLILSTSHQSTFLKPFYK